MNNVLVIGGGTVLSALLGWFFFGPRKVSHAELLAGVQEVTVVVRGGYSPDLITVREGIPVRITFDRQESGDCTARVVFSDFALSQSLPAFGTATVEFTPQAAGGLALPAE